MILTQARWNGAEQLRAGLAWPSVLSRTVTDKFHAAFYSVTWYNPSVYTVHEGLRLRIFHEYLYIFLLLCVCGLFTSRSLSNISGVLTIIPPLIR